MSVQKVANAAKIYKKVMMVPPVHFDVIHKGLNAHMKYEINYFKSMILYKCTEIIIEK